VLFQQHRKQENLERQGMRGIRRSRQVFMGSGEQVIQRFLVAAAQGAPETQERFLLFQENLGNRGKCTSHNKPP
jgi:hypothetical protein